MSTKKAQQPAPSKKADELVPQPAAPPKNDGVWLLENPMMSALWTARDLMLDVVRGLNSNIEGVPTQDKAIRALAEIARAQRIGFKAVSRICDELAAAKGVRP